ncbi:hypothetical protein KIH74_31000 [Kineosporia sp. J2-2]|uniref:Uncharacterized protein n=1 Tax=Kineosporia corallincola TaxID=2835133 RepID=A0ABS5TRJ1_9ACTN|nr:hypothetical protein [Kineosporia corallincola]MBT0773415.1 hypothetical protein [Kineosporia corallincola]
MMTGTTLDAMGAGVVALLVQPLLRKGERIRAIVPEDHAHRHLHVVTRQRYLCFDRRQQSIVRQFEVRTVVRAEQTQDGISHRADVECSDGTFKELRVASAQDARILGAAVERACDEALHDVDPLLPDETEDPTADFMLASAGDQWSLVVSRPEVRARDASAVIAALAPMLSNPLLARRSLESVVLTVEGYDDREELWEIPEVRTFLQHLDARFPYWFYFLDKQTAGLSDVVRSVLPVEFTSDDLRRRLTTSWVPALRQVSAFAGLGDQVADVMIQRSLSYLRQTPGEPVTPPLPELAEPALPEPDDDRPEPLDPEEVMGDLAELLADLPSAADPGPGDELLVYLWSVLRARSLVRRQTQVENVRAVASLLALHRLKTVFQHHAFGEGGPEEHYEFPSAELIGEFPRAEPFWIGVHAGADATFDARIEPGDTTAWVVEALHDLARNQYDEVVPTLRRVLGRGVLFAALWTSNDDDALYPVPAPVVERIVGQDPTGQELTGRAADAWDWLLDQGR